MAIGDLALPVGHVPVTATETPNLLVCIGRPFRQPVDLPDSNNFSPGLELWLFDDYPNFALFAMFDGELRFIPAAGDKPNMLQLRVNIGTQKRYNQIPGLLEPVPYLFTYENVNKDFVNNALSELIQVAYAATSNPNQVVWHPIMWSSWNGVQLKHRLDLAKAQGGNAFITEINDLIAALTQPVGPIYPTVSVLAGDLIGAAAPRLATDHAPASCDFAASACRVTIMIEEYAHNKLSPTYYIWRLLKNAHDPVAATLKVQVVTRAPIQPDHTFDHPLLKELGLNLDNAVKPRVETNALMPGQVAPTNVLLFPTSLLSEWHGVQWANDQSTIEWRITNDNNLDFETRRRAGVTLAELQGVDIDPQPQASPANRARMQRVWNDWSNAINETCLELQFPSELVVVTIAHESNNVPRALALEALRPQDVQALHGHVPQAIIDAYRAITPRYGITVPNPWQGNAPINLTAPQPQLTWDQLLDIVDVVHDRMSPGLMQTLVQMAIDRYGWLQAWYPDVPGTFGVADPFGGTAGPLRPRDWFRWLLIGPHSILIGTAYHKYSYAREGSRLDLQRMASLYNAGQRTLAGQIEPNDVPQLNDPDQQCGPNDFSCPLGQPAGPCNPNVHTGPCRPNPWRMKYNNLRYPRDVTRFYNAINDLFGTVENGVARFWRTIP